MLLISTDVVYTSYHRFVLYSICSLSYFNDLPYEYETDTIRTRHANESFVSIDTTNTDNTNIH